MSRLSDEKKDHFAREIAMTSSSAIRNMQNMSQTLEKEKLEKSGYIQHKFSADANFRTHDLLKPAPKQQQGRNIVPGSLGPSQLHSMPPLLPNYITGSAHIVNPVPINHNPLMRGAIPAAQHGFPTHIQTHIGIGAVSAISSPRGSSSLSQRAALPTLKPTNLQNQIQLPINQIPGLPTLPPSIPNRTGSPIVTTHGLSTDNRGESRVSVLQDHNIRGNIQATPAQATIQVIASGTAVQKGHLPATFLNKGMNLSTSNMLKISVSSHTNPTSSNTGIPVPAFKLGFGKPGTSSVIIPATTSTPRPDLQQDGRHIVRTSPYNRFPVNHILSTAHTNASTVFNPHTQSSVTISNIESRCHQVGGAYPISAAYVFRDLGINISHQLIRPPTPSVNALPTFMPIVSIAVSTKGNTPTAKPGHENARSESLTIQGNTSFNIQNLYPTLQTTSTPGQPTSASLVESSIRPGILRKRAADNINSFPVHPSEKERIHSPLKTEIVNAALPTRIYSPANMANERLDSSKSINHSIVSLTSDIKTTSANHTSTTITWSTETSVTSTLSKSTVSAGLLKTQLINTLSNHNTNDCSPKKKPRKQSIITTEDKYGCTPNPINNAFNSTSIPDADEEFLKSNETMKDVTPPKPMPSSTVQSASILTTTKSNNSLHKTLFENNIGSSHSKVKLKQETKEIHLNGMLAPLTASCSSSSSTSLKTSESSKIYVFRRRRPQHGILNEYKVNTKAAHNHFYRQSDVKVKEEKKTAVPDYLSNKITIQSATGWRLHHLSEQFNDMASAEKDICDRLLSLKEDIPQKNFDDLSLAHHPTETKMTPEEKQLYWIKELLLGNVQRCNYLIEQMDVAKKAMFKVLDHKPKVTEIIKNHKLKPRINKKKPHS